MVRHCTLGTPTPTKPPAEPSSRLLREQVGNLLSTFFLEKSAMKGPAAVTDTIKMVAN